MKTPTPIATTVVIVLLALGTVALVILAIITPVGDVSNGLRAWNVKVLLGIVAAFPLSFAVLVVIRVFGRRSDARFANGLEGDLVFPVYIYPLTREQILSISSDAPALRLATRAMMTVGRDGIGMWGRPRNRVVNIPWSEISTVVPTKMSTSRGSFDGLSIVLTSPNSKVETVLVGRGLLGIPSREQAVQVASRLRALRA